MRENITQAGNKAIDGRTYIDYDWYAKGIPGNVKLADRVYIDTSYGFASFYSLQPFAMRIGKGSGCYDRATFVTGKNGIINIGEFNILNGCTFICNQKITIGNHCMFAWGSVITDSWIDNSTVTPEQKRNWLITSSSDPQRFMPLRMTTQPVQVEDNVWVGFDAVILPGITLGRGCIVGSKCIVTENVPPYTIVAGNPSRIVRNLEPDDTAEMRTNAMKEYLVNNEL